MLDGHGISVNPYSLLGNHRFPVPQGLLFLAFSMASSPSSQVLDSWQLAESQASCHARNRVSFVLKTMSIIPRVAFLALFLTFSEGANPCLAGQANHPSADTGKVGAGAAPKPVLQSTVPAPVTEEMLSRQILATARQEANSASPAVHAQVWLDLAWNPN